MLYAVKRLLIYVNLILFWIKLKSKPEVNRTLQDEGAQYEP